MKVVRAIFHVEGRTLKKSHQAHIDNGEGLPLCGGRCHQKDVSRWACELGEPTCVSCIKKADISCTHPGCDKPIRSSGLCATHYYSDYNQAKRKERRAAHASSISQTDQT